MGFSNSQYVVVRHNDTEHDHIHIIANRVSMDGAVVSESNEAGS
ncbi:relaxase/mobilization nuclease domain-containing protein [Halodesulfovibrio sp.]